MSKEIVTQQASMVPPEPGDENLLSVIARAVADPRMDVEKMSKLLDMHERIMADQRKISFMAAMSRLQEKLPQIEKYGKGKNNKYAKLEDIDVVIRPMLAAEGFSLSFDEETHSASLVTFIARISHRDGHSEVKRLTVPVDAAASNRDGKSIRPAIQDAGSTVSYARRYLIKMLLNIIEKDEDTDGEPLEPITADQAKDLEAMIDEVKADKKRFLTFMGVDDCTLILRRDHEKAVNALEVKRRAAK
jgi:hypothetical protein